MASRSDHYRRLANHCRQIAKTLPNGSMGWASLIRMAQVWDRLAYEASVSPPGQQQQQIQSDDDKKE
jgi:hypothetical protein